MSVFVNRSLNLKQIAMIGFDMDYTLVRYDSAAFEALSHGHAARLLVSEYGYPAEVANLQYDPQRALVGLVIDKRNGNLLKLSRYGKVKMATHGLQALEYRELKHIYENVAVELSDPAFMPLDTLFAISTGVLFSQLVDLKDKGLPLPDFAGIAADTAAAVDMVHRNGSIKKVLRADLPRYVIQDPLVPGLLERYKDYGKKLMIITNSDYDYTRDLLDYALNPFWKKHTSWREVFDVVITLADKPRFFERTGRFLKIDADSGLMSNYEGSVATGLYQGGWFKPLQQDLGLDGREILYVGDHIYGDVVSIKKRCDWRTALVLDDLRGELENLKAASGLQADIDRLMERKSQIEATLNRMDLERYEGHRGDRKQLEALFDESDSINAEISEKLQAHRRCFNPYWGEVLRAGQEESRYAGQLDDYACIYMTQVSDLYDYSPKTYFRPRRRLMAHEQDITQCE
ncbi:MAG: HAD-IG family 5'-nucleotidase [Spirochaetes bacterium]|nr:HAD-IG family 5'-nucleotidase [Spirochaetota bacterium]MBU0956914.1 HAD-IG family 5'-nucleotidase [Spirochaetota bacterium]